jgi:hypothetical protein
VARGRCACRVVAYEGLSSRHPPGPLDGPPAPVHGSLATSTASGRQAAGSAATPTGSGGSSNAADARLTGPRWTDHRLRWDVHRRRWADYRSRWRARPGRCLRSGRAVSVTLRRLHAAGRLRLVRKGKSNHEALYVKATRPAAASPASPETPQSRAAAGAPLVDRLPDKEDETAVRSANLNNFKEIASRTHRAGKLTRPSTAREAYATEYAQFDQASNAGVEFYDT